MKNKTVSIIIPCYNALPYLKETIKSALNQTYPNIEIIVIDDGSTDGSYEYVKNLNHPNFLFKRNQRKGACAARNYGLELAKGEYIQFVDADDLLSPDKIEKQVIQLQKLDKNTIASCGWVHFEEQPNPKSYLPQKIDHSYKNPIDWLIDSWNGGGMGQTGVWLISKELILKAGEWNESLLKNQDGEFMARILCHASAIVFVEDVYAFYRRPALDNVSQNKSKEAIETVLRSYKLYEYVLKFRDDNYVRKALAMNYNHFIYIYFNTFPDLATKAKLYVLKLGQNIKIPFSKNTFKLIAFIFGWNLTLKLRKAIKGY
jgi:glycosyltransferase involved in cell wall biosynthesis